MLTNNAKEVQATTALLWGFLVDNVYFGFDQPRGSVPDNLLFGDVLWKVLEPFSKSRHCNYWASHSGLLLDGSMWFHVQRWSKLSQTCSVTNTQFSQPMSGRQNRQRLLLMIMMVEGPTFSLPAFTTPPRRRSGHFYCVLTTPSVCPGHNQVLLFKSAPSKTICRASKQAYSCCKSSKLFP